MSQHEILINKQKCIGCKACYKDCVSHNIIIEKNKAKTLSNDCIMCGHCVAVCPQNAVTISGYTSKPLPKKDISLNAEDLLATIQFRRTIRQFSNKEIPKNIIEQILQAGKFTHTAKNSQDVSYVVLDNKKEIIQQYAVNLFRKIKPFVGLFNSAVKRYSIDDNFFFFKGNVVIVIISKSEINGALAAQNMEFVAQANGLGVLYSGFFSIAANTSRKIKKELSISKSEKVITTLVLGYPNVEYYRCAQREDIKVKYM